MSAAQAVEELVHQYYKLVFHTIYGLTNNWEESQDLTQDTFHQALKAIDSARASSGARFNARAWLLSIALNTVRMQRRRRAIFSFTPFSALRSKTQPGMGEPEEGNADRVHEQAAPVQPGGYGSGNMPDPAELIPQQDLVQRVMTRLAEPLRICLLLSVVGGLSNAEIASLLDIQEAAVRQRLSRARKQFQQFYEQESGEELLNTTDSAQALQHDAAQQQPGNKQDSRHTTRDSSQRFSLAVLPPTMRRGYA